MSFLVGLSELTGRPHEKVWKNLKYIRKNYHKVNEIMHIAWCVVSKLERTRPWKRAGIKTLAEKVRHKVREGVWGVTKTVWANTGHTLGYCFHGTLGPLAGTEADSWRGCTKVDSQVSAVRSRDQILVSLSLFFCHHLLGTLIRAAVATALTLLEDSEFREGTKESKEPERKQYSRL